MIRRTLIAALCWFPGMLLAQTLDIITGFESGDAKEFTTSSGSPSASNTAERTGTYGLLLPNPGATVYVDLMTAVGNEKTIWSACMSFADATPVSTSPIMYPQDSSGTTYEFRVALNSSGNLVLQDSTATAQITGSTVLQNSTYYCIEAYVEHTATGEAELFLDGVSEGSDASADYDAGVDQARLYFNTPGSPGSTTFVDDVYVFRNVTDETDRCSNNLAGQLPCEVWAFSGGAASATPDTGTDLDAGNWSDGSGFPSTPTDMQYTGGTASGDVDSDDTSSGSCSGGPAGCDDIYGEIVAANWVMWAERGNGSTTVFKQRWGNSVDAVTATTVSLGTSKQLYRQSSSGATTLPEHTEYCSLGFEKDAGGQDMLVAWHACYILHQPDLSGAGDLQIIN